MFKVAQYSAKIFLADILTTNLYLKNVSTANSKKPLNVKLKNLLKDINMPPSDFIKENYSGYCEEDQINIPSICSLSDQFPTEESNIYNAPQNPFILMPIFEIKNSNEPKISKFFDRDKNLNQIYKKYDATKRRDAYYFGLRVNNNIVSSVELNGVKIFSKARYGFGSYGESAYFIFYDSKRKCRVLYVAVFIRSLTDVGKSTLSTLFDVYAKERVGNYIENELFFVLSLNIYELTRGLNIRLKDTFAGSEQNLKLKLLLKEENLNNHELTVTLTGIVCRRKMHFEIKKYLSYRDLGEAYLLCET
ncbi:hypothetical protein CDIK_2977 [Cucumispora dikerogammari]|nr:hypothetical protein CDIK_2977 [Cucumispora dikerogammari]